MRLTPQAKNVLKWCGIGVAGIAAVCILYFGGQMGLIPGLKPTASAVPNASSDAQKNEADLSFVKVAAVPLPTEKSSAKVAKTPEIRTLIMAWNSQQGEIFANGGPITTEGSLMEKAGVRLNIKRQDNVDLMKADLLAFAQALKAGNPHPTVGAHFFQVMGDGAAPIIASIRDDFDKLGPEYQLEIIGSAGRSYGEDQFMTPPSWVENPQNARGGIVICYLRDGDWNIAMDWCRKNGILVNPDEKTYNPNALNMYAADDFLKAAEFYITGSYRESRPMVDDKGKRTGETFNLSPETLVGKVSVATWTPGDVNIVEQKGGLITALSTAKGENESQMPNVIVGIKKWNADNADLVTNFLDAIFQGSDQVKSHDAAKQFAARASARVYNEKDAAYWAKYYNRQTMTDKQGLQVKVGGSAVHNLADNLSLFGLVPGRANNFSAVYTYFGDISVQYYPDLIPSYVAFDQVFNPTYLNRLKAKYPDASQQVETPQYAATDAINQKIGQANWAINFESGSARFTPDAERTLNQLYQQMSTGRFLIEIHGHTDNMGNPDANMGLSYMRANAVKDWLQRKSAAEFPENRFRIAGHGQDQPLSGVDPNSSAGRAKNRRVEIVIGTAG